MEAVAKVLRADHVLTPRGWVSDACVLVDAAGFVMDVVPARQLASQAPVETVRGLCIPGVPNVHSHAFQRAMVGLAEHASPQGTDSFWTWRNAMYALAGVLAPADVRAIAAQLYVEMLLAGYTSVGEFHYLHHSPDGSPYLEDPAAMSRAVLEAADLAGVGLTLLPVFYAHGGPGQPAQAHQRRFVHASVAKFMQTHGAIRAACAQHPGVVLGVAPHSLRAVTPEELRDLVVAVPSGPVHIHAAEQQAEVQAVHAHLGHRPVEHLVDHQGANARWCVIHATHMTPEERAGLAACGAVAGVCPGTEANLGDGSFPTPEYLAQGGRWAIGSDSHVSVDPAEELRQLELQARLRSGRRNVLTHADPQNAGHVGHALLAGAWQGGAQALGQPVGALAPGMRADIVVLDGQHPRLLGMRKPTSKLDAWIMTSGPGAVVQHVMVAGRWVVKDGRHIRQNEVANAFSDVMAHLQREMALGA